MQSRMVMKLKYLICNLKAHKTYDEMLLYKKSLSEINKKKIELILAPSAIYLSLFKHENINLASQDISLNNPLKLTGDINIEGLKSLNVKYAIIGHVERRIYYHETERDILNKIKTCLENNIKVIYCIGESLEELKRKVEYQVLEKEIARILNYIPNEQLKNIIIAYEPSYLIGGTGIYNIKKIEEIIHFIKNLILDYYGIKIDVIFGGNINPNNIDDFKKIDMLDGFIIGNSSLNSSNIAKIIDQITLE